jgi:hypothetical protein
MDQQPIIKRGLRPPNYFTIYAKKTLAAPDRMSYIWVTGNEAHNTGDKP